MTSFNKTTFESFTIAGEFKDVLDISETIISNAQTTVKAIDQDGTDVTSQILGTVSISGSQLTVVVLAGVKGKTYTIKFQAFTSNGNKWQVNVDMVII